MSVSAFGTGDLSASWAAGDSRRTFVGQWYNNSGQLAAVVDYGTQNSGLARPDAPPATGGTTQIVTMYDYDGHGRQNKVTDNAGKAVKTFFDDAGKTEFVVGNWQSGFDPAGTLASDFTGANHDQNQAVQYAYTAAGLTWKQIALVDSNSAHNQETVYTYNDASGTTHCPVHRRDLLVKVEYPDVQTTGADYVTMTYKANGALRTKTDQRAVVHTYTYDTLGRLTMDSVDLSGSTGVDTTIRAITRTYDEQGRAASVTSWPTADATGTPANQVVYTYAPAQWGRLTKIEQSHQDAVTTGTPSVQFVYEDGIPNNSHEAKYVRLAQVIYPSTGGAARSVYYRYGSSGSIADALGRLDSMDDNAQTPTVYAQYVYLGAGTIVKVVHTNVTGGLNLTYDPDGDHTYAGFDSFGRVVKQTWQDSASPIVVKDQFEYQYDAGSNRTYRRNIKVNDRTEKYAYDALNRLTDVTRGTDNGFNTPTSINNRQQFGLDVVGNWATFKEGSNGTTWDLEQTRSHNKVNEIDTTDDHGDTHTNSLAGSSPANWFDPAYDAAGNMTEAPRYPTTSSGYFDDTYGVKFTYDAWNRPTDAGWNNPNNRDQWGVNTKFRYDGNHHRIAKMGKTNGTWTRTDYYYNAAWQVLEERSQSSIADDGSEETPVSALSRQLLWDIRYIDSPVLHWQDGNSNLSDGLETAVYYTTDANCNVTGLFRTDGSVGQRYTYTPYGRPLNEISGLSTDILYCGYRYDSETGMYHVRNRYYHPTLGRWLQRDPAGYVDGMNLYEMVRSRVGNMRDPSGLAATGATFTIDSSWHAYRWQGGVVLASWIWDEIGTAKYAYSLEVSKTAVRMVGGTGTKQGFGAEIFTSKDGFSWWYWSEATARTRNEIVSALSEGWRIREIPQGGDCGRGKCGVDVAFKVTVAGGDITITKPATTITIGGKIGASVGGKEIPVSGSVEGSASISIPIGPSETKTGKGMEHTLTAYYRLCPDGKGGYTFKQIYRDPKTWIVRKANDGTRLLTASLDEKKE